MSKLYLPTELSSNNCAYLYDKDIIRVYDTKPTYDTTINYTDYFINSHYLTRTGTSKFGSYTNFNYDCLQVTDFTTSFVYRNDLAEILIIAFLILFTAYFLVSRPIKLFFHRMRR